MRKLAVWLVGISILVAVNYAIWQKEQLLTHGKTVILALAPVDPRSLMQGDYMRLRFQAEQDMQRYLPYKKDSDPNPMKLKIDLFSDTNVNPSSEMRAYMSQAEVGNEVAGEDPTVNRLVEKVCTLLGKEAGIFLPSGTMCNGVSYRVFCNRPGDAIILDETAHPLHMSSGLIGGLVHAIPLTIKGDRGIFNSFTSPYRIGKNISKFIKSK